MFWCAFFSNLKQILQLQGIIMKFLIAIVGMFAVGNAATILRYADPSIIPTVVSPYVAPIARTIVPAVVPATELYDWEAYKVWLNSIRSQ